MVEAPDNILIRKLDRFIRKYYKNQLLKGFILGFAIIMAVFLVVTLAEYFAYFNSTVRLILFYTSILSAGIVLVRWIIIPLLGLYRIGKVITYDQAADIVGRHFPEVGDKLLNTLQLMKAAGNKPPNLELILAGIEQKTLGLKPFSFSSAINLRANRKYLKFALPPALLFLIIIIAAPSLITVPTSRILHYNTFFEKPAPFRFIIQNQSLQAVQQSDFRLDVKVNGSELPAEIFLVSGPNQYKLNRENPVEFNHVFRNLQNDIDFYLTADSYRSRDYTLKVIPNPMVLDLEIALDYPGYTGRKNETLKNSGDLNIPYGTIVTWNLKTRDTRSVLFRFRDKAMSLVPESGDFFKVSRTLFLSQDYSISLYNHYVRNKDTLLYAINVIPDAYPSVEVQEFRDSVYDSRLYFRGMLRDDYGFSRLGFYYTKRSGSDETKPAATYVPISINRKANTEEFYHYFDVSALGIQPGDEVEYYFEVWDNDGVNGSKSARTQKFIFKVPTLQEISEQTSKSNTEIKDNLENALRDLSQLQKDIETMDKQLLDKKTLNYQERKQIEDLLKRQQELQLKIDQVKEQNDANNIREQQFREPDPAILEKQKQLEDLFERLMTDEMKEMFRKLQEMMDKLDKNKIDEMLDKMKLSNKDLEKQLDRNLELFKALEVDKKLSEAIEKLDKLAEEQKNLSEETAKEKGDKEELLKKQEEINSKFQDIRKDLDELEKLNSELEDPKSLQNTDPQQDGIEQKLNSGQQQLQKNQRKSAGKTQQEASEQMEKLSEQLEKMQEEAEAEEMGEDINSLRMILENLVRASFDQEELMAQIKTVKTNDPRFIKIMDRQKKLDDDLKMVGDSLFALSKRQAMIGPYINKEMGQVTENMGRALAALHNRNTGDAAKWQQYIMTSVNNLALLLAESLEQMMQQMQSMNSKACKGGKCQKPGQGKPSASSMRQLQEQLNKRMEQLRKEMEGNNPGKGSQKGGGQGNTSEELARLAAEQEALRQMLQEYGEELKKSGTGNDGNLSEMMKKMEQTETDLVNKMLTNETLKRQQEILTRLLESEKAEKEREMDEKRESNEAKIKDYSNPNSFFEYNRLKSSELELLKTIPGSLKPFFKYKANEYFYNFED